MCNEQVDRPPVSVLVICYNNNDRLEKTVSSVLTQSYPAIELIISDDASSEFPAEEIKHFVEKSKGPNIIGYQVLQNELNMGTVKHLNCLLTKAGGAIIKIISPGDFFMGSHSLEALSQPLLDDKAEIVFSQALAAGDGYKYRSPSNFTLQELADLSPARLREELLAENKLNAVAAAMKMEAIEKAGRFNEAFSLLEDWPLWVEMACMEMRFCFLPVVTVYYTLGGVSTNKRHQKFRNLQRDLLLFYSDYLLPYKQELPYSTQRRMQFGYDRLLVSQSGKIGSLLFLFCQYLDIIMKRKLLSFLDKQKVFNVVRQGGALWSIFKK